MKEPSREDAIETVVVELDESHVEVTFYEKVKIESGLMKGHSVYPIFATLYDMRNRPLETEWDTVGKKHSFKPKACELIERVVGRHEIGWSDDWKKTRKQEEVERVADQINRYLQ
jgi:hypothetical protein